MRVTRYTTNAKSERALVYASIDLPCYLEPDGITLTAREFVTLEYRSTSGKTVVCKETYILSYSSKTGLRLDKCEPVHVDNIAPSLFGNLVLTLGDELQNVQQQQGQRPMKHWLRNPVTWLLIALCIGLGWTLFALHDRACHTDTECELLGLDKLS